MPSITIKSLEMTEKQKETIAKKFIKIMSEETNVPEDRIYLFFDGHKLDDVACNGKLFSKNPPKNIIAKFNQREEKD